MSCLRCKKRKAYCRGLCKTDYNIASRLVKQGRTTWKELERKKKCITLKEKTTEWFLN